MEPTEIQEAKELFREFERSAEIQPVTFHRAKSKLESVKRKYPGKYDELIDNLIIIHLRALGMKLKSIQPDEWDYVMIILFMNKPYICKIDVVIIRDEIEYFYKAHIDDYKDEMPRLIKSFESLLD